MKFTPKDIKAIRKVIGIEEPEPPKPKALKKKVKPVKKVKNKRKWVKGIYNQTVLATENPDFKPQNFKPDTFKNHRYA